MKHILRWFFNKTKELFFGLISPFLEAYEKIKEADNERKAD
jgi:hypothetical protein